MITEKENPIENTGITKGFQSFMYFYLIEKCKNTWSHQRGKYTH